MMPIPKNCKDPPDKYVTAPITNNWAPIYTNFFNKSLIFFYNLFSYC